MLIKIKKGENLVQNLELFLKKIKNIILNLYKYEPKEIEITLKKKEKWLHISGKAYVREIVDEVSGEFLWLPKLNNYRGHITSHIKVAKYYLDDWNELGFFYSFNKKENAAEIIASKLGILRFCEILEFEYPEIAVFEFGNHDHIGPFMHLVLHYEDYARFNNLSITGSLNDFTKLSNLIRNKLEKQDVSEIKIDKEYSLTNKNKLIIKVKDDDFEPGSLDPSVKKNLATGALDII